MYATSCKDRYSTIPRIGALHTGPRLALIPTTECAKCHLPSRCLTGSSGGRYQESTPSWPQPVAAPEGSPNIVFILLDDVGFAHLGCYGSDIETPNMDRLANGGLRYTNFHTTAMCSPTRASLMTGRNHHAAGLGIVTEFATGYPGYAGRLTKRAATLAEMLRPHGLQHVHGGQVAPDAAPRSDSRRPVRRLAAPARASTAGTASRPATPISGIRSCARATSPSTRRAGRATTSPTIWWTMRSSTSAISRASPTGKPFFLYAAFGAAHWPHQAPAAYIDKYRGSYDAGWDVVRGEWLAKQKALGIVPAGTELPPLNEDVPAWDELTPDEQRVAARQMEVYAGFLDHTDAQIGRLIDYLEEIGQLDNTMIALMSDNGASNEGMRVGCFNVYKAYASQVPEPLEVSLEAIDRLGDETTNVHYPTGWAQAGNTPFKWYKKNTHGGGVRDPLIIHWPARITQPGLRHQYHHVTDLVPTVLELLGPGGAGGLQRRAAAADPRHQPGVHVRRSRTRQPARRSSTSRCWATARSGTEAGRRWRSTRAVRTSSATSGSCTTWTRTTPRSTISRPSSQRRLREMVDRWWVEAGKYDVLPLDDRDVGFLRAAGRPGVKTRFVYYPGMARVERQSSPNITNRSYTHHR